MSLEQVAQFVLLRRLLRSIDPAFVLYTRDDLAPGQTELDLERKTLVISDATPVESALPIVLFQIGHVFVSGTVRQSLGESLASVLERKDKSAASWAYRTQMLFWPDSDPEQVRSVLEKLRLTEREWVNRLQSL